MNLRSECCLHDRLPGDRRLQTLLRRVCWHRIHGRLCILPAIGLTAGPASPLGSGECTSPSQCVSSFGELAVQPSPP